MSTNSSRHVKWPFFFKASAPVHCGILGLQTYLPNVSPAPITTLPISQMSWGGPEDSSDWPPPDSNPTAALLIWSWYAQPFHSGFLCKWACDGQLYEPVVRACAVGARNTAKIQSFCPVSALLFLLTQKLHLWNVSGLLCLYRTGGTAVWSEPDVCVLS